MKRLFFLLLLVCTLSSYSQTAATENPKISSTEQLPITYPFDLGFGLGMDYGGIIGVKFTYSPIPYIGVFAGAGWDIVNFGWTVGALGRVIAADSRHVVRPYIKAMFGANGVTKVIGAEKYDKIFYGPTVGAGLELRFGKTKKHGMNLDFNVPFRSKAFYDQINKMEADLHVGEVSAPMSVGFSIGYHFGL